LFPSSSILSLSFSFIRSFFIFLIAFSLFKFALSSYTPFFVYLFCFVLSSIIKRPGFVGTGAYYRYSFSEIPSLILYPKVGVTKIFRGFPQFLHTNSGTVPYDRVRKLRTHLTHFITHNFFFRGSTVLDRLTYRRFLDLFRQTVELLGRVISPSQGLYLHSTTQHRNTPTNIHALSGIRTHDPSNQPAKTHASDRTATVTGTRNYTYINRKVVGKASLKIKEQKKYISSKFYFKVGSDKKKFHSQCLSIPI
jgi:hypothetical protein